MSFIVAGLVEEGLKELVLIPNLLKEKSFIETKNPLPKAVLFFFWQA